MQVNEPLETRGVKARDVCCLALDRLAKGETERTPRLESHLNYGGGIFTDCAAGGMLGPHGNMGHRYQHSDGTQAL